MPAQFGSSKIAGMQYGGTKIGEAMMDGQIVYRSVPPFQVGMVLTANRNVTYSGSLYNLGTNWAPHPDYPDTVIVSNGGHSAVMVPAGTYQVTGRAVVSPTVPFEVHISNTGVMASGQGDVSFEGTITVSEGPLQMRIKPLADNGVMQALSTWFTARRIA